MVLEEIWLEEESPQELLQDLDMVLIMTVNPGFGGQKFIESQLEKIHMLRHTIQDMGFDCDIEVDGGINEETSRLVRQAGANVLVAGAENIEEAIKKIRG
jgi:ribulose-phosphate 3-epimerase